MTIPDYARGYEGFAGRIGRTEAESEPAWPAERRARPGSPNIIVVLVDDMGFSDIGPYGSEIPTPHLDALAARGIRSVNHHTTPVCSPARAALLTGINPHRAGYASVANSDPGYPNLRLSLADDVLTLPEILREAGYATYAVGKWHLAKDSRLGPDADRGSWPLQRGFDHYYGSLEGLNSFFHPNQLVRDNTADPVTEYPDDFYVTDALTDTATSWLKDLRAHDADKPFFLYFAHIAMHGPLQVKESDLLRGDVDYARGWDIVRERRFARQRELGLWGDGVEPAGRNREPGYDVPAWEELTPDRQRRFAKYMQVYAAMVRTVDDSLGRLLATVDELGELDDTIVVFSSDNGGTAEGGPEGTRSYFAEFAKFASGTAPEGWEGDVDHPEELIGSARLGVHYPRGWGQVSNTPFRFYKGQTFAGGVRVPLVLSWPGGLDARGVRDQYSFVTDVAPTLLDLAGVGTPGTRNGIAAKQRDGLSQRTAWSDPTAPSARSHQYSEFRGHRGYYRDGWKLLSRFDPGDDPVSPRWELYDNRTDPAETRDLAAERPALVAELAAEWEEQAWRNTVFPIVIDGSARNPAERRLAEPVRLLPGTPVLERYRSAKLVQYRDFRVEIDAAVGIADEGVLVAHGDALGGYLVYVEAGEIVVGYNAYGRYHEARAPIEPGEHRIDLAATVRPGLRWDLLLSIDGAPAAHLPNQVQLIGMAPWTGISVGLDARGPVAWDLRERRGTFPYSGVVRSVTYRPGPIGVPDRDIERLEQEAEEEAD
ncbi:Sulfatase OS=Tsukamurella paurometabola (strain ATCC 8368 / DSM / CCUG 35730 / CIP 100753 /JCM 10117 / KCTC 9821 / NBRC 16120 / NCIMB 702349 / NCTC 13040)OX=521096 GN=Tpau_2981 PE=3 SV=1 [Tsukamurella paurometabola]|uniref:Sulfatase n=1 Tax=Tsukamurella paurometabola (strain ATCC 8368 / DSM 20162 / CCUG 35730 / CIP 100753 / JCM 10117 / KCTC 9821 / NBRC 16120 / NCIMB 702349 / NCTC 13040) TaxID=521096 RepID=D5UU74_TSUPD|nr:arylsulfatase [Tsukamurella paurometabola]ADG79577.1 sulfatase [Tsukamurella paurometabola DSM 20162]SUP36307.1 Arylsulfatase [Tsukamurella paurometabola]